MLHNRAIVSCTELNHLWYSRLDRVSGDNTPAQVDNENSRQEVRKKSKESWGGLVDEGLGECGLNGEVMERE